MDRSLFARLATGQTSPALIALVTFATTVAAILAQPGATIA